MVLGLGFCCPCRRFLEYLPTGTLDLFSCEFLTWLLNWTVPSWSSLCSQGAQGHGKWKSIWLGSGCQGAFPKEAEMHVQTHVFQAGPPASRAVSRLHQQLWKASFTQNVCAMLDLGTLLSDFCNSFIWITWFYCRNTFVFLLPDIFLSSRKKGSPVFLSRTTKLNGGIRLKSVLTHWQEKKSILQFKQLLALLSGQCSYPLCPPHAIRIAGLCRSSSSCRGASTDMESNLNGALCKEWCKEDRCPTSCCCLVLLSSISIAQDLSGCFPGPLACLQSAQAPALERTEDSKTHTPPFFLGDSCQIKEVWRASGLDVRTQEAGKTHKGKGRNRI